MKRAAILLTAILLLCSLMSGCDRGGSPEALHDLRDPRSSIPFPQCDFASGHLETSFAEYYIRYDAGSRYCFIQVRPVDSDRFFPLCGKPNCTHDDRNCNACTTHDSLGYCGGRLFTVADSGSESADYALVSMLPDGTDRRIVAEIPSPVRSDGGTGGSHYFVFHEDHLLALYMPDASLPLEEQVYRLFAVDLNTGKITEPFADYFSPTQRVSLAMRPVGSVIYTEAYERSPEGTEEARFVAMDMQTGEVRDLFPLSSSYEYTVTEDAVIYLDPDGGLMEYDLRTGKLNDRGMPVPGGVTARVDGNYIYVFTDASDPEDIMTRDYTLHILDRELHEVDQVRLGLNVRPMYCGTDRLYFKDYAPGASVLAYSLDKTKIGTGSPALSPLE